jgi:predicted N-acetyltransferase YhbS
VEPALAGKGIGAGLMQLAIARAGLLGHDGIVLVGDPAYYARFGFTAAATNGLAMPAPVERRRLLGLELRKGALADAAGTIVAAGVPALSVEKLAA